MCTQCPNGSLNIWPNYYIIFGTFFLPGIVVHNQVWEAFILEILFYDFPMLNQVQHYFIHHRSQVQIGCSVCKSIELIAICSSTSLLYLEDLFQRVWMVRNFKIWRYVSCSNGQWMMMVPCPSDHWSPLHNTELYVTTVHISCPCWENHKSNGVH